MIIKDETLDEVKQEEWDSFIGSSNNGTIFSLARFYRHHDNPVDIHFISCMDGIDQIMGICGVFSDNTFVSPAGASYGGFIAPAALDFETSEKGFSAIMDYFKTIGVQGVKCTSPPLGYSREINQNLDFLMRYYGFYEDRALISSITNLEGYSEKSLSSMCRRAVRKSVKKNVMVSKTDNLDSFYDILVKNKSKFNLEPTHSKGEIDSLLNLFPDKIHIMGAFVDGKMIAGTLNMRCTETALLTFYIASDEEYQKFRPVNRLLHEVCLMASKEGAKYVDFGVSMETDTDNPMDPRRSLIHFKEHFNSRGYLRSRMVFESGDKPGR